MALLVLIPVLVGAVGCSSSDDPPAEPNPAKVTSAPVTAFTEGDCRTLAPTVLDAGRTLGELGNEPPTDELLGRLIGLREALQNATAPSVATQVEELTAGMGFVQLRTATGSYGVELRDSVLASYASLVAVCTGQPAPTTTPATPPTAFPTASPTPS